MLVIYILWIQNKLHRFRGQNIECGDCYMIRYSGSCGGRNEPSEFLTRHVGTRTHIHDAHTHTHIHTTHTYTHLSFTVTVLNFSQWQMTTGIDRKLYNYHGYLNQQNKVFKKARVIKCPWALSHVKMTWISISNNVSIHHQGLTLESSHHSK